MNVYNNVTSVMVTSLPSRMLYSFNFMIVEALRM